MDRKELKFWLLAVFLVVLFGSGSAVNDEEESSVPVPKLCLGKETITNLRFYIQDLVGGNNRTVWEIAKTNLTDILPSAFGLVSILDNLVTSGPGMDSGEVGRIQGIIGLSDFHEKAIFMLLNLVFTDGQYKGSGLCILGRNPLEDKLREVPIVGGTGVFRMARGYAVTRTYYEDEIQHRGIIEYNVVVAHRDEGECVSDV
ncbi:dirigent protein 22-like [Primulina huaijiensis]|uniref:dirigent protein 22-like n=1 Tax=Primulina huaijiensis TaxID=1492673 RepID=UPI003CC73DAA